jgi:stage V sporulation protein B
MKKKNFLYGAMLLTISAVISKILGAVYRIPLTNLIGSEGIGIYQMIFPVYALLLVVSSSGIPVFVSRLVSSEVSLKRNENLSFIFRRALFLSAIISLVSSLLVFFLAKQLASLQGNTFATLGFMAVSPAIVLGSLVAVFRGYFEGLQNMKPTAISEVIEQVAKVGLGLLLAFFLYPSGLEYGVMGAVLGIALGEIVSLFVVFMMYVFHNKKLKQNKSDEVKSTVILLENKKQAQKDNTTFVVFEKKQFLKRMFFESLPITFGATIVPLTLFLDSILMVNLLTNVGFSTTTATRLFGLQAGVVGSLIHLPIIISVALSTALLPNIVAANTVKNTQEISKKSSFSIKLVWFIAFACFLGYLLLSKNIAQFLYRDGLDNALIDEMQIVINLITMSAISIVYHSLLRIFTSLLHAINKSSVVAKNLLIASIVKIGLTVLLVSIPSINIYGASIASTIGYLVGCTISLLSVKKRIVTQFSWQQFFMAPFVSGAIMVAIILLCQNLLVNVFPSLMVTIVSIVTAGVGYLLGLFLFKGFLKEELQQFLFFRRAFKQKQQKN